MILLITIGVVSLWLSWKIATTPKPNPKRHLKIVEKDEE